MLFYTYIRTVINKKKPGKRTPKIGANNIIRGCIFLFFFYFQKRKEKNFHSIVSCRVEKTSLRTVWSINFDRFLERFDLCAAGSINYIFITDFRDKNLF